MSNQKNYKMKRFVYAIMLLLGLSIVSVSCSTSPEAQAKKDAKAVAKALDKKDAKAKEKAWANFAIHKQSYEKKGEGKRYQDTFDDAIAKEINK